MPIEMNLGLSEDRLTAEIQMPGTLGTLKLKADELTEFLYHLAGLRASMLPQHPNEALKPETLISNIPAVRWHATEDQVPGQARLYMLHPGFGWLFMGLLPQSVEDMAGTLRMIFRRLKAKK